MFVRSRFDRVCHSPTVFGGLNGKYPFRSRSCLRGSSVCEVCASCAGQSPIEISARDPIIKRRSMLAAFTADKQEAGIIAFVGNWNVGERTQSMTGPVCRNFKLPVINQTGWPTIGSRPATLMPDGEEKLLCFFPDIVWPNRIHYSSRHPCNFLRSEPP